MSESTRLLGPVTGPFPFARVQRIALLIAAVWVVSCIAGWIFEPAVFYRSYLCAWFLWLGVTLGAMGIVMLHHLMGGNWGYVVRRLGEHAAMTLPLMIVLFIPILIGIRSLYIWANPDAVAADPLLQHKRPLLNVPFFLLRAAIYGGSWLLLAWYLRTASLRHDRTADRAIERRLNNVSAGGQVLWFVTMSLAALDWVMSREPHWYSTVFGFIVVMGQAISGLCVLIACAVLLLDTPPFRERVNADQFNDLGNLLLTCVIVWTYMSFAQLLVIWMGNKQDEIAWYVPRMSNGWWWIGGCLILFHFFVPFIVLLMRSLKRSTPVMLGLCVGLLVLRGVDVFWMIAPAELGADVRLLHALSWMNFVFPIGMGALWVAVFLWLVGGHPLMPEGDTELVPQTHAA